MKCKLLKRLRAKGRESVNIISITKTDNIITGIRYSYDDSMYSELFRLGDSAEDIKNKAVRIYIEDYLDNIRT